MLTEISAFPSDVWTESDKSESGIPVFGFWYAESALDPCSDVARLRSEAVLFPFNTTEFMDGLFISPW